MVVSTKYIRMLEKKIVLGVYRNQDKPNDKYLPGVQYDE